MSVSHNNTAHSPSPRSFLLCTAFVERCTFFFFSLLEKKNWKIKFVCHSEFWVCIFYYYYLGGKDESCWFKISYITISAIFLMNYSKENFAFVVRHNRMHMVLFKSLFPCERWDTNCKSATIVVGVTDIFIKVDNFTKRKKCSWLERVNLSIAKVAKWLVTTCNHLLTVLLCWSAGNNTYVSIKYDTDTAGGLASLSCEKDQSGLYMNRPCVY